jgi:hypothetical protein
MYLKVEKSLTAVFAAALGASFIATNPDVKASAETNPAVAETMHIRLVGSR